MNKKRILWISVICLMILVAAFFIYKEVQMSYDKSASAVSVIGGADGPTSIFLAGKIGGDDTVTYTQITMDEAKQIFESDSDGTYIILDVRRADEFAEGHIPGAINIANESIDSEVPAELPDMDQIIYVYCRSGNRSKQAAEKLAAIARVNPTAGHRCAFCRTPAQERPDLLYAFLCHNGLPCIISDAVCKLI